MSTAVAVCEGRGVVSARGCLSWGYVCITQPPSLWREFLTHVRENITFPQLHLQTVKIVVISPDP